MSCIDGHCEVRSRAQHHMNPQQHLSDPRVPELVIHPVQELPHQHLHQLEGDRCQGDEGGGIGDGEGLALAPQGNHDVGKLAEEGGEGVQAIAGEEVEDVLDQLGIFPGPCGCGTTTY